MAAPVRREETTRPGQLRLRADRSATPEDVDREVAQICQQYGQRLEAVFLVVEAAHFSLPNFYKTPRGRFFYLHHADLHLQTLELLWWVQADRVCPVPLREGHHAGASMLCIAAQPGQPPHLLLVRTKRGWAQPGGAAERSVETGNVECLEDTARREVLEETGYQVNELDALRVAAGYHRGGRSGTAHLVLAHWLLLGADQPLPELAIGDADEVQEVRWWPLLQVVRALQDPVKHGFFGTAARLIHDAVRRLYALGHAPTDDELDRALPHRLRRNPRGNKVEF